MQALHRWATRRSRRYMACPFVVSLSNHELQIKKRGFGPVFHFARSTSPIKWGGFRQQRDQLALPARNARRPHCAPVSHAGADIDKPEQPVHHAKVCAALQAMRGD